MHLTKAEDRIYDGEGGWAQQTSMKILVRLGELFGAEKLIPIDSAHVSGVSYKTLGDAPIDFLKAFADSGARVTVRTTVNPQSLDLEYLAGKIPQNLREKQLTILDQFRRMKMINSLTCTPYYLKKPVRGAHLAWAESSAVVYTNSILDSFTNREGGPSALAAAIIGKTPDYGIHRPENRRPTVLVNLESSLRNETEFGALGIHLGKMLENKIPSIPALRNSNESELKQFGAALGTSGMVNMFRRRLATKKSVTEEIDVEYQDVRRTAESLSTASNRNPDLVFLGCPHYSSQEIKQIAGLIKGRKVKSGLEFWVCTSCRVKNTEKRSVKQIEACGGHVLAGVCTVVSWTEKLGIDTIMTNSAKTAYYAPTLNKAKTILAPLSQCLDTALKG